VYYEKKIVLLLIFFILLTNTVPVFAASTKPLQNSPIETYRANEEVIDENGNVYTIEIIEYTEYPSIPNENNGFLSSLSRNSSKPRIGEKRTHIIRISNDDSGFPSLALGVPLTSAMKTKIAKVVGTKLSERLGFNFIPGLNVVSWLLASAAFVNSKYAGNNGFTITTTSVYSSYYSHREGYTIEGWDLSNVSLGTY